MPARPAVWASLAASAAAAAVAASLLLVPSAADAGTKSRHAYGEEEKRVLSLLNDYRAENGLAPLLLSDAASVAAEKHNFDLAKYGYTGHETRESDYYPKGMRSWDRMAAEGYPEEGSHGENLAYGQDSPGKAMEDWKKSDEGHNENMLDERWKVVGISFVESRSGDYDHYWATDFGSKVDESAHEVDAEPPPGGRTELRQGLGIKDKTDSAPADLR